MSGLELDSVAILALPVLTAAERAAILALLVRHDALDLADVLLGGEDEEDR